MKFTAVNYLVIGILAYYLFKGILFLLMWQTLVVMEDKGKKAKAKQKAEKEEQKRRRREFKENTKS